MTNSILIDEDTAIGLIPARGGSKSIPLKNLAPVGGKPLIRFVIDAALGSRSFVKTYCSTDHDHIARTCLEAGVEIIERPAELGLDDTPVTAVILHALETLRQHSGRMPGMVALLQPTSPFLLPSQIHECITPHIGGSTVDAWRLTESLVIDMALGYLRSL